MKGMVNTMTKETLKGFGLTDEQVEQVWNGLTENYITKSRFNEVNTELKQLKDTVKERDEQLETLKTESGAAEKLKTQISELQAANAEKDKQHAAEMKRVRREALDERLLVEAKAINPTAVKPFLAAIDDGVDDEGYTAVRKQHIEALTKAESTKFLFQAADNTQKFTGTKPGETGTQQPSNSTGNPFAKGETYNEAEQIKMFRENPELARTLARQAGLTL